MDASCIADLLADPPVGFHRFSSLICCCRFARQSSDGSCCFFSHTKDVLPPMVLGRTLPFRPLFRQSTCPLHLLGCLAR
ncbi:hypothetical protein OPV22_013968 [Ensete ventricosum]|uniref:Uncharacterized protein n=1 Tax=Ensete ventricosum TaxID=4639 RepID=A0AAV8QWS2_ENSVE|nr:hypothetical protein OPV22_013968 [Ensete ventricosum]